MQLTEIVNAVYVKFLENTPLDYQDRGHFYRVAARQMRWLLLDHGRARRGPERRRDLHVHVPMENLAGSENPAANALLHELLGRLDKKDPIAAEVVELKVLAGMTNDEVAQALNTNVTAVRRRWASAQQSMLRSLTAGQPPEIRRSGAEGEGENT